ncbi:hypothetical protein, partial [Staphylococcus pettenkoferi]|uniref:hypothetical protein n=1 Tax=Staphylococcus pettenkoferi TaxID=170573 RepID=UPI001C930A8E
MRGDCREVVGEGDRGILKLCGVWIYWKVLCKGMGRGVVYCVLKGEKCLLREVLSEGVFLAQG